MSQGYIGRDTPGQIFGTRVSPRLPILLTLRGNPGEIDEYATHLLDEHILNRSKFIKNPRPCILLSRNRQAARRGAQFPDCEVLLHGTFGKLPYETLPRMFQQFILPVGSNSVQIVGHANGPLTVEPSAYWNMDRAADFGWVLLIEHPTFRRYLSEWTYTDPATRQSRRYHIPSDDFRTLPLKMKRLKTAWLTECSQNPNLKRHMILETIDHFEKFEEDQASILSGMSRSLFTVVSQAFASPDGKACAGLVYNEQHRAGHSQIVHRPDYSDVPTRAPTLSESSAAAGVATESAQPPSKPDTPPLSQDPTPAELRAYELANQPPPPQPKSKNKLKKGKEKQAVTVPKPDGPPSGSSPADGHVERIETDSKENAAPPPTPTPTTTTPTKGFFSKNDSKSSVASRKKPSRQGTASSIIPKSSILSLRARFFE